MNEHFLKDSNPKDAIGVKKVPFSTLPAPVLAEMALGMLEGALKYGRHNYRAIGVRTSVYYDACLRHLLAFWEGEDIDPDSGLPHIVKAIDCLVVLRDAQMQDKVYDDRPPVSKTGWVNDANDVAKSMISKCENPRKPFIKGVDYGEDNRSEV